MPTAGRSDKPGPRAAAQPRRADGSSLGSPCTPQASPVPPIFETLAYSGCSRSRRRGRLEQPLQAQGVVGQLLPRDAGGDRVGKAGGEATGLQRPGEESAPRRPPRAPRCRGTAPGPRRSRSPSGGWGGAPCRPTSSPWSGRGSAGFRSPRPRDGAGRDGGGARRSGSSASGGGWSGRPGTRRPPRPGGGSARCVRRASSLGGASPWRVQESLRCARWRAVDVMLLGPPRVERDGAAVAFDTRKAVALLAVLALADRPRPRDVLAELLWPEHDAEHARGALRRTLSALRSAVGADFVDATRDSVSLVRSAGPARSTSTRFRAAAVEGRRRRRRGGGVPRRLPRGLRAARRARRSRTGSAPRPTGCGASSPLVLARLVEATGDLAVARRWLELDPLHEPAHRALIRLYAEQGDRAAALAQYRECVRTLSRELGVPPLDETTRLYEAISEGTLRGAGRPAGGGGRAAPARAARRPRRASGRRCSAPTTASRPTAASCCSRARRGSARRGWPRSWSRDAARRAAPRCWAAAPTRRRRRSPTARWSRRCAGGCARTTRGWRRCGERALGEAARLLGDLSAAPPPPLDGPAAQARFLDGVWETLAAAAAGPVPGVLVIDDVQWADEATLGLLDLRRAAAGGPRACSCC